MDVLDRRDFIRSLAAGAVAAGVPLPMGFPRRSETIDILEWDHEGWVVTTYAKNVIRMSGWRTHEAVIRRVECELVGTRAQELDNGDQYVLEYR